MKRIRIYISGPMRGIPYHNVDAFDAAASKLQDEYDHVYNPAAMDRWAGHDIRTYPPDTDWSRFPYSPNYSFEDVVKRDIRAITKADAMYMLRGWENSKGARAEHAVAIWLGKEILFES